MPSLKRTDAGLYQCMVRNRMGAVIQRRTDVQVACKSITVQVITKSLHVFFFYFNCYSAAFWRHENSVKPRHHLQPEIDCSYFIVLNME